MLNCDSLCKNWKPVILPSFGWDWETYIDKYMPEEIDLVEAIQGCTPIRNRWKEVIKNYNLNELSVMSSEAKRLISIK